LGSRPGWHCECHHSAHCKRYQQTSLAVMSTDPLCKGSARADLLDITAPMRSRMLANVKDAIKHNLLADPDMWHWVRSGATAALDRMLSHVELEIERNIQYSFLEQQSNSNIQGPIGGPLRGYVYRLRAFILHHYLPHNKSFFGKLEDPVYLAIYIMTCLPVHGLRVAIFAVVLLMLVVPGPPDESQLINFIVSFKGVQFFSSGLVRLWMGAMEYFACYSLYKDELLECVEERGPGVASGLGEAADYLGNIALVWIAFYMLPYSKKHVQDPLTRYLAEENSRQTGGRLHHLLHYDMKCFVVSLCTLLALTLATCGGQLDAGGSSRGSYPQFCANIFWCCALYSTLSLPFVPFMIPCVQTILTHCDPTGYNESGACVAFELPAEPTGVTDGGPSVLRKLSHYAKLASNFLSILERGRKARDLSTEPGDYVLGDVSRGLFNKLVSKFRGEASQAEALPEAEAERRHPGAWLRALGAPLHGLSAAGREARGRGADAQLGFGDLSLGLFHRLASGHPGAVPEAAQSPAGSAPSLAYSVAPGRVAFVSLPAEAVVQRGATTFFCVEGGPSRGQPGCRRCLCGLAGAAELRRLSGLGMATGTPLSALQSRALPPKTLDSLRPGAAGGAAPWPGALAAHGGAGALCRAGLARLAAGLPVGLRRGGGRGGWQASGWYCTPQFPTRLLCATPLHGFHPSRRAQAHRHACHCQHMS